MRNQEIKEAAKKAGVKLWQIAESIGISDFAFSRKLRYEIPESERIRIFAAIEDLKRREV